MSNNTRTIRAKVRAMQPGSRVIFQDFGNSATLANTLRHYACQLGKEYGRRYAVHVVRAYGEVIVECHEDKPLSK